jgi:hypothetical protein
MSNLHEITQQILTYLIELFGFIALFILPAEYIIKCHIDEVRSWGVPGKEYQKISIATQVTEVEQKAKTLETPKKEGRKESGESTKTKTKRTRKKNIEMIPA